MNKTINVKGQASLSFKPDLIILLFRFSSIAKDYAQSVQINDSKVNKMLAQLEPLAFKKDDFKTTLYQVNTHYESYQDENNQYKSRFAGYLSNHHLKLSFDLDMKRLAEVITAISQSESTPEFDIKFSIKDNRAVNDALLKAASDNAHRIANTLAKTNKLQLGNLIRIDYSWIDVELHAKTDVLIHANEMPRARVLSEFVPEDIEVSDSLLFVWELI